MTMPLAIAPIGWSNDDLPELGGDISFERCITEMAAAQFQGCEVGHKFPRDQQVLRAALEPLQLQVASAWYSTYFTEDGRLDETMNGFIQHMQFLKAMGAKVIVVCECGHGIQGKALSVTTMQPEFSPEQWQALFAGLRELMLLADAQGMTVVYHHHMGTGVQTLADIDYLLDHSSVDLLLDTGHLYFAGEDPLAVLRRYVGRIKHVHLKDIRADVLTKVRKLELCFLDAVKEGVFTVPGDGCIDFAPILQGLREAGYSGWLVVEAEQDPEKAPPLEYAVKARRYLEGVLY